jgi:hypothetical protein
MGRDIAVCDGRIDLHLTEMARPPDAQGVYEAAERWVDVALRTDDSLFTPGVALGRAGYR